MRFLTAAIMSICLASNNSAQTIELNVDQSQSNTTITVMGQSASSSVTGNGTILLTPSTEPFSTGQFTEIELVVADGFEINFFGGLVSIQSDPASTMLSLVTPGAPGNVDANNQFDQPGNLFQFQGTVDLFDPLGLAGGTMSFDLSESEPALVDLSNIQLSVDGPTLTVNASFDVTADTMAGAVDAVGTVVLTGDLPTFLLGDVNLDGIVNLLDVGPFVDLLAKGRYQLEADMNQDGVLNLLDVSLFVDLLADGG